MFFCETNVDSGRGGELPPDTAILWRVDGETCSSLGGQSPTLVQLAGPSFTAGGGHVLITLSTRSVFTPDFDASNVNHATIVNVDAPLGSPPDGASLCPE